MILFNIGSDIESTQICQNMYTFDFKHANMEVYLLDYDFDYCIGSYDIEAVWTFIKRAIMKAIIPKVKKKSQEVSQMVQFNYPTPTKLSAQFETKKQE